VICENTDFQVEVDKPFVTRLYAEVADWCRTGQCTPMLENTTTAMHRRDKKTRWPTLKTEEDGKIIIYRKTEQSSCWHKHIVFKAG